jgi:K+-sensing histidine kinase KdpD
VPHHALATQAAHRWRATDVRATQVSSDSGIGIAPEDQAAIFEEFRQVGREDARKQEGTGLGLTLAKRFVELHGGHTGSRLRWARARRSPSRCRFGLQAGVRAIRAEASLHGHDVSPYQ